MASSVDICNMALSICGAGSIANLETDTTRQAQQCRLFYEICRDTVLSSVSWGFAHKLAALALTEQTVFNWAYVYAYPVDCLHINNVIPNITLIDPATVSADFSPTAARWNDPLSSTFKVPRVDYEVMNVGSNKVVVCNEANARIDYRAKITDAARYTPTFIMALAHLLATHIARPLVGESAGAVIVKNSMALYMSFKEQAAMETVNERFREQPDSDFITVRG